MRIKLDYPIERSGVRDVKDMGFINIRRPIVIDLLGLDFTPPEMNKSLLELIVRVSDYNRSEIEKLDSRDFLKISEKLSSILNGDK